MATPATWIALANDIMRSYKSIEDIEPDEFWKDEQERSDWFEAVADTGHALANLILQRDKVICELRAAGWEAVADDIEEGIPAETVLRRLRDIGEGGSDAVDIVAQLT